MALFWRSTYQYLPASCVSKAKYYYSCSCGAKGTETFESGNFAAHMYTAMNTGIAGAKVSDATCVSKAVYYKSCVGCGALGTETFETGEVNLTNHVGNNRTEYTNLNGSQHLKKITCDACNTMKSSTNENHTMNAQNTCTLCNSHVNPYNQKEKYQRDRKFLRSAIWVRIRRFRDRYEALFLLLSKGFPL